MRIKYNSIIHNVPTGNDRDYYCNRARFKSLNIENLFQKNFGFLKSFFSSRIYPNSNSPVPTCRLAFKLVEYSSKNI